MAEVWLEQMIDEIRTKEIELTNLKRAANTFYRSKGEPEPFVIDDPDAVTGGVVRIRPDEYYGKGFATAAGNYMERRKQAVTAEEILKALEAGGFDFDAAGWKDVAGRARTVAMSLAKNTAIFHRLPSGTFGLKKWYGDAIEKKKAKKADVTNGSNDSDGKEATDDEE